MLGWHTSLGPRRTLNPALSLPVATSLLCAAHAPLAQCPPNAAPVAIAVLAAIVTPAAARVPLRSRILSAARRRPAATCVSSLRLLRPSGELLASQRQGRQPRESSMQSNVPAKPACQLLARARQTRLKDIESRASAEAVGGLVRGAAYPTQAWSFHPCLYAERRPRSGGGGAVSLGRLG